MNQAVRAPGKLWTQSKRLHLTGTVMQGYTDCVERGVRLHFSTPDPHYSSGVLGTALMAPCLLLLHNASSYASCGW